MKLYLFDMGSKIYGDCILAVEGDRRILIDGAHPGDWQPSDTTPSIPQQITKVLGKPPFKIDLLVVTHCHSDHIGCLPKMVQDGTVEFEWALVADEKMGFPTDGEDASLDAETAKVVAAMCEEPQPDLDGPALDQFLTDAVKLSDNYSAMLSKLKTDGTKIVRYTGPSAKVKQIEKAFSDFGLSVLGPTNEHLTVCRDELVGLKKKVRKAADGIRASDAAVDAVAIYRALLSNSAPPTVGLTDDLRQYLDRVGPGAALNDQSIVLTLGTDNQKVLLTGDMQLAVAEVSGLDDSMTALLETIKAAGPYQFVKLPHHASYNGFDENVLTAFKDAQAFGISTGRGDPKHPDPGVLKFLESITDTYHWARTDRNGRITVSFAGSKLKIGVDDGELNDSSPNAKDVMPEEEGSSEVPSPVPAVSEAPRRPPGPVSVVRTTTSGEVEVTAKIPHQKTKVTITIEIEPGEPDIKEPPKPVSDVKKNQLAGGRDLPALLFVTNSRRLADNIGKSEATGAIATITSSRQTIVDLDGLAAPLDAIRRAAQNVPVKGVVILGGYDVVPSERFDTLPPSLRNSIGPSAQNDPDNFIVWSDQIYGDLDGDRLADVPVSRIPDGHTARIVDVALTGNGGVSPSLSRFGLRNFVRPFADNVYTGLPGPETMLTSREVHSEAIVSGSLSAKLIYLMLHGSDTDASRFWGETQGGMLEAMTVGNVPDPCGAVIFAGCCWGALTVRTRASVYRAGDPLQVVTPAQSIALSFLAGGASAFVGCTGAHYSPVEGNLDYFGAPMHSAFWRQISLGKRPAEALFQAKIDYIRGMPHGRTKIEELAIENKILRQFTCLGLGW
ncbi:MBL fold metallo-hydrolase [Bradyrhizobium sp. GCM10028915]|uniref:MBL fold metallo-hydrolase n=1 Tax=Bradyrhizobium sp. GCM10028915 TaxID=3273385 RepID=UPI00360B0F30